MKKQTRYLLIVIGIASILAGIYQAVRTGVWLDALSGVFIGLALIGTVMIEQNKEDKTE